MGDRWKPCGRPVSNSHGTAVPVASCLVPCAHTREWPQNDAFVRAAPSTSIYLKLYEKSDRLRLECEWHAPAAGLGSAQEPAVPAPSPPGRRDGTQSPGSSVPPNAFIGSVSCCFPPHHWLTADSLSQTSASGTRPQRLISVQCRPAGPAAAATAASPR